jgi:hypothetical protein
MCSSMSPQKHRHRHHWVVATCVATCGVLPAVLRPALVAVSVLSRSIDDSILSRRVFIVCVWIFVQNTSTKSLLCEQRRPPPPPPTPHPRACQAEQAHLEFRGRICMSPALKARIFFCLGCGLLCFLIDQFQAESTHFLIPHIMHATVRPVRFLEGHCPKPRCCNMGMAI